jgi:hypothetical protein
VVVPDGVADDNTDGVMVAISPVAAGVVGDTVFAEATIVLNATTVWAASVLS